MKYGFAINTLVVSSLVASPAFAAVRGVPDAASAQMTEAEQVLTFPKHNRGVGASGAKLSVDPPLEWLAAVARSVKGGVKAEGNVKAEADAAVLGAIAAPKHDHADVAAHPFPENKGGRLDQSVDSDGAMYVKGAVKVKGGDVDAKGFAELDEVLSTAAAEVPVVVVGRGKTISGSIDFEAPLNKAGFSLRRVARANIVEDYNVKNGGAGEPHGPWGLDGLCDSAKAQGGRDVSRKEGPSPPEDASTTDAAAETFAAREGGGGSTLKSLMGATAKSWARKKGKRQSFPRRPGNDVGKTKSCKAKGNGDTNVIEVSEKQFIEELVAAHLKRSFVVLVSDDPILQDGAPPADDVAELANRMPGVAHIDQLADEDTATSVLSTIDHASALGAMITNFFYYGVAHIPTVTVLLLILAATSLALTTRPRRGGPLLQASGVLQVVSAPSRKRRPCRRSSIFNPSYILKSSDLLRLFALLLLVSSANAACDGDHCCYNSDCGAKFCAGGHGVNCKCKDEWFANKFNTGRCQDLRSDGVAAYNGDYNSCSHKNGICGICGPTVSANEKCSENSDCRSGWCDGQFTAACNGYCKNKSPNGYPASVKDTGGWDYNSCETGQGQCGYCGPSNSNDLPCSANSDCSSGWCEGELTVGCKGACKEKIADNKECPQRSVTNDGFDEACKSGYCMEMLKLYPADTVAYCRPTGGFLAPSPCTQDADCSDAGQGHWCNGGAYNKLGKCELCPEKCSSGCHACDNDITRLNCGRSNTWDKIGCAGEVAANTVIEFLECIGVDLSCVTELADEVADCIGGECTFFEIGGECLSFEAGFEWEKELFEDNDSFTVNLNGNMNIAMGMDLTLDLKEWKFTLEAKSTVRKSLGIDVESSAAYTNEEEKELARKKNVFRKVLMAGKVPVLVEIDIQPMAWFSFETEASFQANMQVSGQVEYQQTFEVDIDDGIFEVTDAAVNGEDAVPSIDNLEVVGQFTAGAEMRVGPRIDFSIYKIPISLDIAAKIGANTELTASYDISSGQACATGSAQVNAGLDARLGVSFPFLDPVAFARESCTEATTMMVETADPANHMVDKAQCFTDVLGIDTGAIDNAQEDLNEALLSFVDNACDEVIDFLVPDGLEQFTAAASSLASGEWANIMSIEAGISHGLCADVELNKPVGKQGMTCPSNTVEGNCETRSYRSHSTTTCTGGKYLLTVDATDQHYVCSNHWRSGYCRWDCSAHDMPPTDPSKWWSPNRDDPGSCSCYSAKSDCVPCVPEETQARARRDLHI